MESLTTQDPAVGPGAEARRDAPLENGTAIEAAKFAFGGPTPSIDAGELPWSYGHNRITILVRSPDSAYLFWEMTDEGLDDARGRLGPAGASGWCCLRIYDTTGRDFDGTNANEYFDINVDRGARDHFLMLKRPGSSFHAEIGVKTHEGYFQPVARSGRADFPRKGPSPNHSLEWMTVTSEAPPCARPYESRYRGPPPGQWRPPAPTHADAGSPPSRELSGYSEGEHQRWTWVHPEIVEVHWEGPWIFGEWRTEWSMKWFGGSWQRLWNAGPFTTLNWKLGPFPIELLDPGRLDIKFLGEGPFVLHEGMTGLEVFGPWQVTIKSLEQGAGQRVLSRWMVHGARVSPPMVQRWWTAFERVRVGGYRRQWTVGGASEMKALAEGGASELWRAGASERMWLGASEWVALGGSEVLWIGASQALYGGASAVLFGGASGGGFGGATERVWGGGSQIHAQGSSETLFAGSSAGEFAGGTENAAQGQSEAWAMGSSARLSRGEGERWRSAPWLMGSSELWAGASDIWLGASEHANGHADQAEKEG